MSWVDALDTQYYNQWESDDQQCLTDCHTQVSEQLCEDIEIRHLKGFVRNTSGVLAESVNIKNALLQH